ncbi:hypothetical protein N7492_008689 [Penicillium capsulatum]|uniref:DUF1168 domain protein n=1 Tax=Penicillium capsulatum TaxID=69766 RepID=A0A9W9HTY5_9EURO|nr:hypothetical protein N7492_008689 [Penicillium capsulatum]KAJ6106093.1 hypothetical protein N7512_009610 [Penicillium capsulatum]
MAVSTKPSPLHRTTTPTALLLEISSGVDTHSSDRTALTSDRRDLQEKKASARQPIRAYVQHPSLLFGEPYFQIRAVIMSEPGPESHPTSADPRSKRPTKRRAVTPHSEQAGQIETLFKNPSKEINLPGAPQQRTVASLAAPPEIVANVQGSSAGAGSGEFHVYKASRRREYERLRLMQSEVDKEKNDEEWEKERQEAKRKDDEKTEKNRRRRDKKKAARGKKDGGAKAGGKMDIDKVSAGQGLAAPHLNSADGGDEQPQYAAEVPGVIIHED